MRKKMLPPSKLKFSAPFILTILLGLIALVDGILINVASGMLPKVVTPILHFTWPLLGILTLLGATLTFWLAKMQAVRSSRVTGQQQFLAELRARYKDYLISAYEVTHIILGLRDQPDAIVKLASDIFPQRGQFAQPIAFGTPIIQIYRDAGHKLLILGEPGAGKTTLLAELANDLLDQAIKDEAHLMPVVFPLSRWAIKRKPLDDWLVEELDIRYRVHPNIGRGWVAENQVLPLLDGLDEMAPEYRTACVDTINAYQREHRVPLVVTSQSVGYLSQPARLELGKAVAVQPLTAKQIDGYLWSARGHLVSVHDVLREDPVLQELATTPLMLNLLAEAYHDKPIESIQAESSPEVRRQQILEAYVNKMLEPRRSTSPYTPQQCKFWLHGLALLSYQTGFTLDRMQSNWLSDSQLQRRYPPVLARLITGVSIGLFFGLYMRFPGGRLDFYALPLWFLFLLLTDLSDASTEGKLFEKINRSSWKKTLQSWLAFLANRLVFGLLGGLLGGLIIGLIVWSSDGLLIRVSLISFVCLFSFLYLIGFSIGLSDEMVDLPLPLPMRLVTDFDEDHGGLSIWFLSLFFAIGVPVFMVLLVGVIFTFQSPIIWSSLFADLLHESLFLVPISLSMAFPCGEATCIKHTILRFFLYRAGYMPRNYVHFLSYTVERRLVIKIGEEYSFFHPQLAEYFAGLNIASTSPTVFS